MPTRRKRLPDVSFLVTAHSNPKGLLITLASLKAQKDTKCEILVSNNATNEDIADEISRLCKLFRVKEIKNECPECYTAGNLLAEHAEGKYLCFPSEEDYYTPIFARQLFCHAERFKLHLAYCDCIYDSRYIGSYEVMRAQPIIGHIDKGGFLLRRSFFPGWPEVPKSEIPAFCDGLLIENLRAKGIAFGKVCEVLWVHN